MERKKNIGVLKYRELELWELEEIQQLKEAFEEQEEKLEIEILIGERYKNLSDIRKNYNIFISYEQNDEAYSYKEGLLIVNQEIDRSYRIFPWRMGMLNEEINDIYFKTIEIINSKEYTVNYKINSKVYKYSISKTKKSYIYSRVCALKRIILSAGYGISNEPKNNNNNIRYNSLIFYIKYFKSIIERLIYGLFYEKKWNIFIYEKYKNNILDEKIIDLERCNIPKIKSNYKFYGDPFIKHGEIFVEALSKKTNLGEIIAIDVKDGAYKYKLHFGEKHYSYPQLINNNGKKYCLPEMGGHSNPLLMEISKSNTIVQKISLAGLEKLRLIDSTYFYFNGVHYIFGGIKGFENQCLNLYYSDNIFGEYKPHPSNPIVINPDNSRMGGEIIQSNGKLYRIGQYNRGGYGEKIKIMEIKIINKELYLEIEQNEIKTSFGKGPHTLNFYEEVMVGDYYEEKFSFTAGVNRFIAYINS